LRTTNEDPLSPLTAEFTDVHFLRDELLLSEAMSFPFPGKIQGTEGSDFLR
jgi:hypothetical protein